jgi:hypothetical protein
VAAIAVSQFPAKAQDTCLQTIADQEFARQGLKLSDASQTYNQLPENSMMVSFTLPFEQYGDFEGTAQSGDEILANCPTVVLLDFCSRAETSTVFMDPSMVKISGLIVCDRLP